MRNGKWDIRVPQSFLAKWPREARKGYWFKIDRTTAQWIVNELSAAYGVASARVDNVTPTNANGWYHPAHREISMHARGHIKTVLHEFYHHLDNMTEGEYDSSDWPDHRLSHRNERTTPASLAWQFAEQFWVRMKELTYGQV